jgi:hypothetical protein
LGKFFDPSPEIRSLEEKRLNKTPFWIQMGQDRLISWDGAIVRLAHYQVFDNAACVLRLRYFYPCGEGAPYTSYFNNTEIFTVLLVVETVIWVYLRARERVVLRLDEDIGMCSSEKVGSWRNIEVEFGSWRGERSRPLRSTADQTLASLELVITRTETVN